jgi:hypothetical protein
MKGKIKKKIQLPMLTSVGWGGGGGGLWSGVSGDFCWTEQCKKIKKNFTNIKGKTECSSCKKIY